MIVSIHQPDYISYLGYFYKISRSDVFVFLDNCQYSNDNMHNWNRIKTPQGECRLKVPVKQHLGNLISEVSSRDELDWKHRHLKTLKMNYTRARYFADFYPVFSEMLLSGYPSIAEMNITINSEISKRFGFGAELLRASDLQISTHSEQRVIDIVKAVGGDVYISGHGAKAYQIDDHFTSQGIKLVYTDYAPVEYRQLWNKNGFIPMLSVLDYIFNCGFDWDYVEKSVREKSGETLWK